MKKLLIATCTLFSIIGMAQRGYKDSNRIGISGGLTQMSIFTNNFSVTPQQGWTGGFHVRGNFYNNWQMSFGMFFTDSNFSVQTRKVVSIVETNYKLSAVQIYLMPGFVVSQNHFNIEFGPVLQINDKLVIDKADENNLLVDQPLLTAKDITDVTKINANIYAGVNLGVKNLRLRLGYQYGLNNFFGNLNNNSKVPVIDEKFKGNLGIASGQLTIYL
ncbi:PorT family protein [Flavobacterium difficile]|uniref:PorT family protein n=1 Tax=Flavobacterium difficile TaxID=2709659 RepID=A0ABX0I6F5_9FLAO|nr:PorT family protein [Flavobacterium difficile]NHM02763.1 PorT family protein [Flavobacterium difficile]